MFWDRNNKAAKALVTSLAIIGTLAVATPAMAQSLVVRSTGPSASQYPAGKKIAASGTITLKRGDRVTVLDKGRTRVLSGPGTFSLNRQTATAQTSTRVASFVATGPRRRARTGAVRGAGAAPETPVNAALATRSPNLWFVDVSRGGTHCVVEPEQVLLWRPEVQSEKTVTLSGAQTGADTQIVWRRGSPLRRWPSDVMPVQNGATYAMTDSAAAEPVTITVKLLPSTPEGLDATAEALLANGCDQQLDLLVEILASNDGADTGPQTAEEGAGD